MFRGCPGRGRLRRSRVLQIRTERRDARRHHLQLDERERAVVEHDDFDRQALLGQRDQIAQQHRQAAVTGKRDDLAPRECSLRADRH